MKVRLIVTLLATASILALVQSTIEDDDSIILESDPEEKQESDPQNPEESDPQNPEESEPQNPGESDPQNPEESDPQNPEESDPQNTEESDPQNTEESDPQNPEESDPQNTEESDPQNTEDSDPQNPEEDEQPEKSKRVEDIPGLSEDLLTKTIDEARKETLEEEAKSKRLRHHDEKPQSSLRKHFMRGHRPELEPHRVNALIKERTIRKLAQKLKMTPSALEGLESASLDAVCRKASRRIDVKGKSSYFYKRFRTIDGSRNNRVGGKANTPFRRLIEADYGDGLSTPRKAKNGSELPNARFASKTLFDNANKPSKKLSHMAMIWGQFLDHDITQSAESDVDCSHECGPKGDCFGIAIPKGDNAFKGRSCIELKRNVPFCGKRKREQINTLSAFIDASAVYSNDEKKFEELRDPNDKALLIERKISGRKNLLSADQDPNAFCRNPTQQPCFRAGDPRVNENSGLASMHTIWNRYHNLIVTQLRRFLRYRKNTKKWTPDYLFFTARKIIGAMVQHITFREFLPAILSRSARIRSNLVLGRLYRVRKRRLSVKRFFYLKRFKKADPSIFNSFATAAYRFGHSLVQNQLSRFAESGKPSVCPISMDNFFNTSFLYQRSEGGVDSILRGLEVDPAQEVDGSFAKAVHEKLVRFANDMADLPALNMQRGRDHGIPGYNRFRILAGLRRAKKFSDLRDVMTNEQIRKLRKVYNHVDDIDLFAGGVMEKPFRNGAVGKTFSFIIAKQFHNLRFGDRFWYENRGQFTPRQLREIRKSSLARVICDNSDGIKLISPIVITPGRRRVQCRRLPRINLRAWL